MEKNIIQIKVKPKKRIARRADGTSVVKIREEATEAIERLIDSVEGEVSIMDLVSQPIIYAAENTGIKLIREEQQCQK